MAAAVDLEPLLGQGPVGGAGLGVRLHGPLEGSHGSCGLGDVIPEPHPDTGADCGAERGGLLYYRDAQWDPRGVRDNLRPEVPLGRATREDPFLRRATRYFLDDAEVGE